MDGYFGAYASVGLLFVLGMGFVAVGLTANRLLRPHRPSREKVLSYECGVDAAEGGWAQSRIRYFVFAFLYVIFAVDAVFLFPWATVFAAPGFGAVTFTEMIVFLAFLSVGIAYAWRKGVLTWV
jgi:NADH-quinone oxidoreductase subunit A